MASGDSDFDEVIPQLHRNKRRRCLKSSEDDSDSRDNLFHTPKNETDGKESCMTRSSERIRQKRSRVFHMPKRTDVLDKIQDCPSASMDALKPRKLVNDLMRVTNRYNHSPAETSGEESGFEFIDDSLTDEDRLSSSVSANSEIHSRSRKKKYRKTRICKKDSSDDNEANMHTNSDVYVLLERSEKKKNANVLRSSSESSDSEELAENSPSNSVEKDEHNRIVVSDKKEDIEKHSSAENCEDSDVKMSEVLSVNDNSSTDEFVKTAKKNKSIIIHSDDSEESGNDNSENFGSDNSGSGNDNSEKSGSDSSESDKELCRSDRTTKQKKRKNRLWEKFKEARKLMSLNKK